MCLVVEVGQKIEVCFLFDRSSKTQIEFREMLVCGNASVPLELDGVYIFNSAIPGSPLPLCS